jgi:glycosyltransferase involved in cell wall biosynthesis
MCSTKQMRVFYSFPLRMGRAGGVEFTAWSQVRGLIDNGLKVDLFCGSLERPLDGLNELHETLAISGRRIPIRLIGHKRAMAFHDRVAAMFLARVPDKYDIVHCWPSGALLTLKTAKNLGIATVLERPSPHTRFVFETVAHECKRLCIKAPKRYPFAYEKARLEREEQEFDLADKLLCPSEWVAKTFRDLGTDERRLLRHRYGFDPTKFSLPADERRKDDPVFKVVYLGRGEPDKGLHYALDAWLASEAAKNGIFYICGKWNREYQKSLGDRLRQPSVVQAGYQKNPAELLQKCHALVLASLCEGSALVTYEAKACGCVLLVSAASGAHCKHNWDSLVHPVGNVAALRDHINRLCCDRAFFAELQRTSISTVCELTWEKAGEVLVSAYRQCLASRQQSSPATAVTARK